MLSALLLILGFGLLVKGADFLVDGSSSLAKRLKVSDLAIGLTIVAFGTSAPELIVNIMASFGNQPEIAIGNVLGSNIANILLILGITAIIYPLSIQRGTIFKEIPFALLAVLMVGIMANDMIVDGLTFSSLTRSDGLALLGFFIIFLYYTFGIAKVNNGVPETHTKPLSLPISIVMVLGGLGLLVVGGRWVVNGAVDIATAMGVSTSLIGLTIVAVGTSLPELATSAIAAYKKKPDIAVGNVVGSNIFNIFFILGISAVIKPLPFSPLSNIDIFVTMGATILLFLAMFVGKKHHLERWQGVMFLLLYAAYIVYLVLRG